MGLGLSHGKFSYSYSTFKAYREYLAKIAGIKDRFNVTEDDTLKILLEHSDCDGEIGYLDCDPLADRLTELLPKIDRSILPPCFYKMTEELIESLRLAAQNKENLRFI